MTISFPFWLTYKPFFRRSLHYQLQAVPVPRECEDTLKSAFMDTADSLQVELLPVPPHASLSQMSEPGAPYFFAELPRMVEGGDGKARERLFHRVRRYCTHKG